MRPLDLATRGVLSSQLSLGMVSRGALLFTISVSDFDPFFIIPAQTIRRAIDLAEFSPPSVRGQPTIQVINPLGTQMLSTSASINVSQPVDLSTIEIPSVHNAKTVVLVEKGVVDLAEVEEPELYNKEKV